MKCRLQIPKRIQHRVLEIIESIMKNYLTQYITISYTGWSKNVTSNADSHYAHMLVLIVLEHWNTFGINGSPTHHFESISHDNSFLSYHPFEFSQRNFTSHRH